MNNLTTSLPIAALPDEYLGRLMTQQWLIDYTLEFAQEIAVTTKGDITNLLRQAQEEGWSIPKASGHLKQVFQEYMQGDLTPEAFEWYDSRMPSYRRERIVRTETMRASNTGVFNLTKAMGIPSKEWIATLDGRERPEHAQAMADYSVGGSPGPIPVDKPFELRDGSKLMYPGDPSLDAPPAQTIQCRCSTLPYDPAWAELDKSAKGGPGSGNFGHAGILGSQGGSMPGGSGASGWRPTMNLEDAEEWATDSSFKDPLYHGTSKDRAKDIGEDGFEWDEKVAGRFYGDGAYFFYGRGAKSATKQFAEIATKRDTGEYGRGRTLETRINVKKVRNLRSADDFDNYIQKELMPAKGYTDLRQVRPSDITTHLTSQGYDALQAIEMGTNHNVMVVFDKTNIAVVK